MLMALKGASSNSSIWGCSNAAPPLGSACLQRGDSRVNLKCLRYDDVEKWRGWERCCLRVKALEAVAPAKNDEKPNVSEADQCSGADDNRVQQNESKGFNKKDAYLLPKPLTAFEFSPPSDGSKMRVAYQGIPGAYNEDAALKAFPKCETVPCDDYETSFENMYLLAFICTEEVELWSVDKAILPIESSITGSIHRNYDLLLRHNKLHIVGEVQLQVNYCLLGLPAVKREELKRVSSHPQALTQCAMMLSSLGVVKSGAGDTASAAKAVASNGARDTGAIASSRAAKLYGLDILAEKIQDDDDNITRFLILAREPVIPGTTRLYKTSIAFILEEGSGVLFKALAVFSMRNINLSKIESRPLKEYQLGVVDYSNGRSAKCFDYLFYIDFEASMAEPRAQNALEHLQEFARFLRVLGCYPVDKSV